MFLSQIYIKNFRGIKELLVEFDKKLNVIIGSNGQLKTSLIDAIRLFYAWGEPNRDIEITKEDFRFVPAVYKTMLTRLKQGEYIIQNPVFRSMLNVNFPLPIYKYYD